MKGYDGAGSELPANPWQEKSGHSGYFIAKHRQTNIEPDRVRPVPQKLARDPLNEEQIVRFPNSADQHPTVRSRGLPGLIGQDRETCNLGTRGQGLGDMPTVVADSLRVRGIF